MQPGLQNHFYSASSRRRSVINQTVGGESRHGGINNRDMTYALLINNA